MRRLATLAALAGLALVGTGCDVMADYDAADANAQCAAHGGVLSVDSYGSHIVVCQDRVARNQNPEASTEAGR